MVAGDLIVVEMICAAPCVHDWCRGPAQVYRIGRLRLRVCQGCAAHGSISDHEMQELLPNPTRSSMERAPASETEDASSSLAGLT